MYYRSFIFIVSLVIALYAVPVGAHAATLSASPAVSNVQVGDIVRVSVVVNSGGVAINNAEGVLNFAPDFLQVISLSSSNSIFSLWVEQPSFSNATGEVRFNGGVPSPGFTGSSGTVLTAVFSTKRAGTTTLSFTGAAVRANDGLGTDVLAGSNGATVTVVQTPPPKTEPTPTPTPKPPVESSSQTSSPTQNVPASRNTLAITSATHTDSTKWYATNTPEFSWKLPKGALEVRTLVGTDPSGVPFVSYDPPISTKKVDELPDGTYYFSVRVRDADGWSAISRYRVNIDTTPPKPFDITFPESDAGMSPRPVISFNTTDDASGVSHYEIKIQSEEQLLTVSSADAERFVLPPQLPGKHTLTITAFDNAGNMRTSTAEFTVEAIDSPIITYYTETIDEGESVKVRGTTYPDSDIVLYVREGTELIFEEHTKSNALGDFVATMSKELSSGVYTFTVRVTDTHGAQSNETVPLTVTVRSELVSTIIGFVLKYLSVAVLILLLLGGIVWLATRIWFRILLLIARMRRETREAEQITERAFKVLREGVVRHVDRLKRIKTQRKLTEEEILFLEEFEEKLEEAEDVILKEIRDITD